MQPNGNGNGQLVDYQDIQPAVINPLDASPAVFKASLDRRKENRSTLMDWIRSSLIEGRDYGSIMIKGQRSKPSLLKPGAEKIVGMLGLIARFPNLKQYEDAVLEGTRIDNIILRCELRNQIGEVIGVGVGARSVDSQDHGDLNKSLKMAAKSAMIDCTLRTAGISEIFTQDVEDMARLNTEQVPQPSPVSNPSQAEALASPKQQAAVRSLIDIDLVYPDEKRQIHELIADGLTKAKAKELLDYYYGISILVEGSWTKSADGELARRRRK
jgi:hypothetical protein